MLNVLFGNSFDENNIEIKQAYISECNLIREILFDDFEWRKIALLSCKKLSTIFKNKNSNDNGYFYCLNCLRSSRTEEKRNLHESVKIINIAKL